jgi:predicted amidophosphoribosyltransferase
MYCEQCQSEYPDDRKFCPQCGVLLKALPPASEDKTIATIACPFCGKAIQADRKFCIYCGQRIRIEPELCPACSAPVPAEALFCGDCGAPLTGLGTTSAPEPTKRTEDDSLATSDHRAQGNATFLAFLKWLRRPELRIVLSISFLFAVGFFSYRLGSLQQIGGGSEPRLSPPESPSQKVGPEDLIKPAVDTGSKEGGSAVAPPDAGGGGKPPGPDIPLVAEEPVSPPCFYRVTTPTALRDKPTLTGKEMAQLQSNTLVEVVATVGDWLKVESKSNPPKPPGYVWKEDAKLE